MINIYIYINNSKNNSKKDKMAKCKEISFIENIKSSFIMNSLFSFLNKKQKLKLIIYNKKLQKRLGVDIKDYQKISGKYIKKNGK